jgi:hypothetical protein
MLPLFNGDLTSVLSVSWIPAVVSFLLGSHFFPGPRFTCVASCSLHTLFYNMLPLFIGPLTSVLSVLWNLAVVSFLLNSHFFPSPRFTCVVSGMCNGDPVKYSCRSHLSVCLTHCWCQAFSFPVKWITFWVQFIYGAVNASTWDCRCMNPTLGLFIVLKCNSLWYADEDKIISPILHLIIL